MQEAQLALQEYQQAEQNFQYADSDFAEIAILEFDAKMKKLDKVHSLQKMEANKKKPIRGVIEKNIQGPITEREFKEALRIATDDIKANNLRKGHKTKLEYVLAVASIAVSLLRRKEAAN